MDVITFTAEQFASLAKGYGDPSAIAVLADGQVTKRLVLLHEIARRAGEAGRQASALVSAALGVLIEVDTRYPEIARYVLGHPQLGAWAVRCLRGLPDGGTAAFVEVGQVGAFASAAAARAGLVFDLTVPTQNGVLVLPTLGAAGQIGGGLARVRGDGHGLVIAGSTRTVAVAAPFDAEARHWAPLRTITVEAAGRALTVAVEDLDPHRDCYSWRPTDRLPAGDLDRLRALLAEAWRLIVRDHPQHADGLGSALRSVVPLLPPNPHGEVSAASRDAFGSLAVSLPADAPALALLLIHEFQHVKLGGLLDLVDLHRRGGVARHYAPWRPDPRPVSGLFQGAYAYVGVTDFWRRQRVRITGTSGREADFEFALRRRQTARAIEELAGSGELTGIGTRFVALLGQTLRVWLAEPVPLDIEAAARDATIVDAVHWRLAYRRPQPADVDRLADAWHRGRPCPDPGVAAVRTPPPTGSPRRHPDLARLIRARATGTGPTIAASQGDRAYLAGDYDTARRRYLAAIQREGSPDGWAGLAVALTRLGRAGAHALAARPELIRAVLATLASYPPPDAVAGWLEEASPAQW